MSQFFRFDTMKVIHDCACTLFQSAGSNFLFERSIFRSTSAPLAASPGAGGRLCLCIRANRRASA